MEMVPQVDVLVAAAPHTQVTERMFNEKVFRSMKKTAYFLALSRGMLFDDMALVEGAQGRLDRRRRSRCVPAGAAAVEPSDLRLPQRGHDRAHLRLEPGPAGASDRRVRRQRPALHVGAPLVNVVDKKAGY